MANLTLTVDQGNAVKGILADITVKAARPVLCGYAGTGKTVTTAALVARLSNLGKHVIVATPTHKARFQVEKAMVRNGAHGFETATVHRLLGLKQVRNDEDGKEYFAPDTKAGNLLNPSPKSKNRRPDVVIVDESSMINSELYEMLKREAGDRPVIFVGDDKQLLPVGEDEVCRAFIEATSIYRLTEVLRHDGAILNLATSTRELEEGRAEFSNAEGGGSIVIAHSSHGKWLRNLLEIMKSEEALKNPDFCRALAWKNVDVNNLNKLIHKERYGEDAPTFVSGMLCVTVDSIPDPNSRTPLFNSTEDVRIIGAVPELIQFPGDDSGESKWETWLLTVAPILNESEVVEVRVLEKSEEKRWADKLKGMARDANATRDKADKKSKWGAYFMRKDLIGKLEPASALTIHKSQGSTFQHVFLHRDIDEAQTASVQNQLAYVGITRAAEALHVVED
jgi:exodeoxyribonuclease-5